MEFLGIGPSELLLILVIMLLVLGPKDMVKMGKEASTFIRKVINSPVWKSMMSTSREIRDLPNKLAHETGLDEDIAEIRKSTKEIIDPLNDELKAVVPDKVIPIPEISLDLKEKKDNHGSKKKAEETPTAATTNAPAAEIKPAEENPAPDDNPPAPVEEKGEPAAAEPPAAVAEPPQDEKEAATES